MNNDIAYVISGQGDRSAVHNVAVAAYDQLEKLPQKSGG